MLGAYLHNAASKCSRNAEALLALDVDLYGALANFGRRLANINHLIEKNGYTKDIHDTIERLHTEVLHNCRLVENRVFSDSDAVEAETVAAYRGLAETAVILTKVLAAYKNAQPKAGLVYLCRQVISKTVLLESLRDGAEQYQMTMHEFIKAFVDGQGEMELRNGTRLTAADLVGNPTLYYEILTHRTYTQRFWEVVHSTHQAINGGFSSLSILAKSAWQRFAATQPEEPSTSCILATPTIPISNILLRAGLFMLAVGPAVAAPFRRSDFLETTDSNAIDDLPIVNCYNPFAACPAINVVPEGEAAVLATDLSIPIDSYSGFGTYVRAYQFLNTTMVTMAITQSPAQASQPPYAVTITQNGAISPLTPLSATRVDHPNDATQLCHDGQNIIALIQDGLSVKLQNLTLGNDGSLSYTGAATELASSTWGPSAFFNQPAGDLGCIVGYSTHDGINLQQVQNGHLGIKISLDLRADSGECDGRYLGGGLFVTTCHSSYLYRYETNFHTANTTFTIGQLPCAKGLAHDYSFTPQIQMVNPSTVMYRFNEGCSASGIISCADSAINGVIGENTASMRPMPGVCTPGTDALLPLTFLELGADSNGNNWMVVDQQLYKNLEPFTRVNLPIGTNLATTALLAGTRYGSFQAYFIQDNRLLVRSYQLVRQRHLGLLITLLALPASAIVCLVLPVCIGNLAIIYIKKRSRRLQARNARKLLHQEFAKEKKPLQDLQNFVRVCRAFYMAAVHHGTRIHNGTDLERIHLPTDILREILKFIVDLETPISQQYILDEPIWKTLRDANVRVLHKYPHLNVEPARPSSSGIFAHRHIADSNDSSAEELPLLENEGTFVE